MFRLRSLAPERIRQRLACFLSVMIVSFILTVPTAAELPSANLTAIFPPGGRSGTTVEVRCHGGDLDGVTQLLFSHPGIQAQVKMTDGSEFEPPQPVSGQFQVQVASDVPPGAYEARAVGRFGVSNPRLFVVGVYDEEVDQGGHATLEKARELGIDRTVNGKVNANAREYFRIALKEGQRVLFDCHARRIDSRLDGTLILYDSEQSELARSTDYAGEDPFLDFVAPSTGEYFVCLHDFLFRGGTDYYFRLTAHLGPHVDFVYPPAAAGGASTKLTIYGRNLPEGKPSEVRLRGQVLDQQTLELNLPPLDPQQGQLAFTPMVAPHVATIDSYALRLGNAVPVPVYYAEAPVTLEQEPNDVPVNATNVSVPTEVAGQLFPETDVDYLQFAAKKGDVYYIDLLAHRLGKPIDARIFVQKVTKNDKGEEQVKDMANVDDPGDRNGRLGSDFDTSTDDPTYRLTADEDAVYRVLVLNQSGAAGDDPRQVYRLVIRGAQPDFRLFAVPFRWETPDNGNIVRDGTANLRQGGTTVVDVQAIRKDGFNDPIEIRVSGLPPGVSTRGGTILAGATSTQLIIEAAEDAAAWAGPIQVEGHARIGDQDAVRIAHGGATIWGTGNRQQDVPQFRATQDVLLAVIPEHAPTKVDVAEQAVIETSRGGKLEVPVKVVRRRDFKGDLKLVCLGLPKELKPGDLTLKGDSGEAKLALNVTNTAAKSGTYNFFLRADTKSKMVRDPQAVPAAEARQKELAEQLKEVETAVAAVETKVKAATEARAVAEKAVQEAEAARSTAAEEAVDAAAKVVEDAKAALTTAQSEEAAAQKEVETTRQRLTAVQAAKKNADQALDAAKKANAAKDVTFLAISTPVQLKIVDFPGQLSVGVAEPKLAANAQLDLPINIERKYGFEDAVEVTLELPKGVTGIELGKLTLAKDATAGQIELKAGEKAPKGKHTITVHAKAKFNNVDVATRQTVSLVIE